jgi:3-dehydroquinate synthase
MFCEEIHSALDSLISRYDEAVVVMDESLQPSVVSRQLSEGSCLWLSSGEAQKKIETVERIWDFLFDQGVTRRGLLVAIGGGVLTDIAGFAASTYKRGIDWVAVPTTLLAMVDASTGGKTGINYRGLKNSIGAFYPPVETLIWPGWLETLPAREMLSGFGEMLKMGLIEPSAVSRQPSDRLWEALMRYDLDTMPLESLTPLIKACVEAKERIVAADPKEEGLRKVLNFGHTFGHAIEQLIIHNSQFTIIPHGYAVVYGMIAELYLSVVRLGCPKEPLQQLTRLMTEYYGRPQCKCSDRSRLIELMRCDKKNERAGEINCTLLRDIGDPVINEVITEPEAEEALDYLFSL